MKNVWDNLVQNSHLFQICAKQKCDSDKNENVEVSDLRNSRDPMESKACNANERTPKKEKKKKTRYILKLYTIFREEFREAEILVNQNNT